MATQHFRRFLETTKSGIDSYFHLTIAEWEYGHRAITLKLGDCNRIIELEFGYSSERQRRAKLAKVARLQLALDDLRYALENGEVGRSE